MDDDLRAAKAIIIWSFVAAVGWALFFAWLLT
jgi:hypothetical protein